MKIIFLVLLSLRAISSHALPRFEVYWESEESFKFNDDESHNPWHIDLGAIDVGAPGYVGGPNVVTIHAADYCVEGCQENYPDEFCGKYPPEGVPAKPRTVDDWGTKFNITSNMMKEGIAKIHERGGRVHLAYNDKYNGISAEDGGGSKNIPEGPWVAYKLANRIAKNVRDWDLDGVDFFFTGSQSSQYWNEDDTYISPGNSVIFHFSVIKYLRYLIQDTRFSISYTTNHKVDFKPSSSFPIASLMSTVIAASHPYLDWISIPATDALDDSNLYAMAALGIPLAKVGAVFEFKFDDIPSTEEMSEAADKIKENGLAGLSIFSINKENSRFHGDFARMVSEFLYL